MTPKAPRLTKTQARALWAAAMAAADAAGAAATPTPIGWYQPVDVVASMTGRPDGGARPGTATIAEVAGRANLTITPGTSSFARWLLANREATGARKGYHFGVSLPIFWGSSPMRYTQSYERYMAGAKAAEAVLEAAGITVYIDSWMD